MFRCPAHINNYYRRVDRFNSGGFSEKKNFFMEKG